MTSASKPLQRPKSLTALALDEIRSRIVQGELALGAPLSENALAAELGVSKTPVREALLQLKSEGLVSIQPQRGSFVFEMAGHEVMELCQFREILENAVLEQAMARDPLRLAASLRSVAAQMKKALDDGALERFRDLDTEFHRAIVDQSDNSFLVEAYDGITFRAQALRSRLYRDMELNRILLAEHLAICERVESGDAVAAKTLLGRHITGGARAYASMTGG